MPDIRRATEADFPGIWAIFHEVVARADTYPFSPDTPKEEARAIWMQAPTATYVAVRDARVVGTYYIKPNQPALGAHVCNAGYMVRADARGLGVGRAMCAHSLGEARRLGFSAMQYNYVASTNERAVRLWQTFEFEIVGTVPAAFRHPTHGLVPVHIMYRALEDVAP